MVNRSIPEHVKRAVRRKCGFGCAICGLPIFDYDHIDDFAKVRRHDSHNLVLLCPTHHREKTAKRLSLEIVKKFANEPMNLGLKQTSGHRLLMASGTGRCELGGNFYEYDFPRSGGRFPAIILDDRESLVIESEDGFILASISFQDRAGRDILIVDRGEMTVSTGVWDYRIVGPEVKVWSQENDVGLDLLVNPNGLVVNRGRLVTRSTSLVIEPDRIIVHPHIATLAGMGFTNCRVGLRINQKQRSSGVLRAWALPFNAPAGTPAPA